MLKIIQWKEKITYFEDKNAQMQDIKGFNQSSIITVEKLPTENIESNTFYICKALISLLN